MTNKKIVESTTAGAVASVAMPLGSTQKRAGSLFKGKKTKKKFYETRTFNSKQELIQYFLSRGKTAAEASAAWERGYRGTTKKKKKSSQLPKEHWVDRHEREKEEREERNKPPVTEQRKNKVYEGKMKNLAHDLQNLSPEEFIKEHKRTKEYFITLLGNPNKNTKVDNVSEAEIVETDLIITPGMKKNKERGFIPHDKVRKDHEVEMARSDVYSAAKDATRIYRLIKDRTEDEGLMGWQQSYITLAADYLNSVADSLEHNTKTNEMTGGVLAGGMSNFEEGMDEGQVNELSPQTLASYKKKAGADATAADKRGDYARGNKRMRGIIKATKKEFDKAAKGVAEGLISHADEFKVELDDDGLVHILDGEETIRVSMPIDIWKRMAGKKGKVDEFSVEVDDGQVHVLDGEENIRVSMPIDIWKQLGKKGVAEGVTEAVWDRPSKSYVPRDGKTFGQTNHPREEHCDACGAATGHAGPGEDSNVDDNGNVYCDDCYSDKQSLGEGSDRDMETEIKAEIRKSEKMKNATRLYYYKWLLSTPNLHAATSYEIFINSWAGQQWFSKHKQKIESFAEEQNSRFLQNYKVDYPKQGMAETEINNYEEGITEEFKNTFSVGDRVDGPLGKGTVVAVSKNVDVDGRVKVKLDDPSRAGEDGRYKDSFVLDTTHLKHINDQDMSEAYHDDSKEQEENLRYSRSRNPVSDDIRKKLNPNQKEQGVMDTTMSNFEEAEERKPRVNVKHLLDKMLQLQNTALMAIDRERWSELEQVKNEMEEIENKVRNSGPDGDKTMDEFFQRLGSKEPIDVLEPKMYKKDNIKENRWRNRLYGLKWNPLDRERREQGARDREARSERNREINAGLEGEEEQARRYEQGPWYILINGKLVKDKSKNPFTFNTLSAAQKAVKTMREKEWNKDKTFAYTKTPKDSDITEGKTNKCPECGGMMVSEELINEKKDACYYKVKSRYKVWPSAYASGALVKCRKKGASNWGKGSKKKTNEDTATEPRKFTKPPGTTIKWSMGLEALLDEYVLLQAQRSAALYRNRHDLAMKHMEKMDELEELILKKPNGQKELAKVKTWMHKKDPEDTSVDDPEKPSDKAVNFQKMVDLRRQGKSYPTIAAELSAMTGKTFKPNSVKSYIGSRPDFADIQQDFAKARGVLP